MRINAMETTMIWNSCFLRLGAAAALLALTPAARTQYDLPWYTIDAGGDMWTTGGDFELSGTIGQPDANAVVMTGGQFELIGGFWGSAPTGPAVCRGDLNCDGQVDFSDINPFVMYLSNFANWQVTYAGCDPRNGDINSDGTYPDFGDINPFVTLMSTGQGPCR
jgi:hypothetical protein